MELPFCGGRSSSSPSWGPLGSSPGARAAGLLRSPGLRRRRRRCLLNVKGYFHLYCARAAFDAGIITNKSFMGIIFMVALNVAVTPMVGMGIASWRGGSVAMAAHGGCKDHDRPTELRRVVGPPPTGTCRRYPYIMEALRWARRRGRRRRSSPCTPWTWCDDSHRRRRAIVKGGGFDGVTVVGEEVSEMRSSSAKAPDAYRVESRRRRQGEERDGAGARQDPDEPVREQGQPGQEEAQMQVDDKFFAEFYRKHVSGSKQPGAAVAAIGYLEKHVADGAELVAVLRGMQADYRLFIVGRGRDRSSVLTEGLDEWAECLELGPVGDILASSDFSTTASVLIVQQYDAKKHYKVIDKEFMPS
ncbi:unnamed protein product [Miscanthus lutarioriparius]|uniref:Cation/H(+) antiporter C-terminal domain-containing protein n=1 Tax=Miscanthus lutarioriparius TaxID=422564 RepID=A0A811NY22_9POAL|nr:unnamed protein product [Miscanthus lutarioriparius]